MSEFELVPENEPTRRQAAQCTGRPVVAARVVEGAHPFERPHLFELRIEERTANPTELAPPGLNLRLQPADGASPWSWRSGDHGFTLSFNGRAILTTDSPPGLEPIELAQLPGLKARTGDLLPEPYRRALRCRFLMAPDDRYYGLGQRAAPLERRSTSAVNWATDEASGHHRTTDPLYQAHPLLWGVRGSVWWAALLLHTPYSRFDLGQSDPGLLEWLTLGPNLRALVAAGDSPTALLESLRQVLPSEPLPPLWALGFHQSRWGYRDRSEVEGLVDEFQQRSLPLDVVHLDIDHMRDYRSFSFSPERFPEPEKLFKEWKQRGVRAVTIVDPGLKFDPDPAYPPAVEALRDGHLLTTEGGAPFVGYCWPDEALFPDFGRARTRQWWSEKARFYLDAGVSGLWIDMNEPAVFDRPFWSGQARQHPMPLGLPSGEPEQRAPHAAWRNLYGSWMAQATREAWADREQRPWVLTRSGFTGVSAFASSWMGDNTSWWEHLRLSLPQLASMSLVGSSHVGVDVGGFFGHCDEELYSAWIEASVLYPFQRAHSALGTREQHPWSYGPEVEETARRALRLRYRLLPYLYTAAERWSRGQGPPLLRPLFFDYPNDPRFFHLEDQVLLGRHLLAAPFLVRGQSERLVVLPEGEWVELHTGRRLPGGQSHVVSRTPGLTPLFQAAGSAIPMLEADAIPRHTGDLADLPWALYCCPGRSPRPAEPSDLYWDDGESSAPLEDPAHGWRVRFRLEPETAERPLSVSVEGPFGGAAPPRPSIAVYRPGTQTEGGWVREGDLELPAAAPVSD